MASLDEEAARRLARECGVRRQRYAIFIIRKFIRFLVDAGVARPPEAYCDDSPLARLRQEYEDYLRVQRGLSARSIYHCWRFADRFLAFRFKGKAFDWSRITALDLARFMQSLTSRRDKTPPTHLRNFFQFLFKSGKIKTNLALSILRVAPKYGANLPKYLMAEQVEQVIAAANEDTPVGRRDYAMVLLQARLGLRAQEVIAIELDDIDWRTGELLVRGKGGLYDRLPLPQDVGEAIANYIRRDRKTASRALFVTHRAPRRAFAGAQILNEVLEKAFRKAGVKPPRRYVGSHILRHSLATNMIRSGASLAEIGDVLRHRARGTTMIYAKLDIEGLRSVAREWPVVGGAK
ncbi:tyrosine-type recombinase/integrase [Bradyrhizobium erythrophlei]|uniref:tyrosine-type recombinase/integrase n=1 Tax=Bradyrhizobium erythrophlei TaxID=1437360 RepID=UPI0035EC6E65